MPKKKKCACDWGICSIHAPAFGGPGSIVNPDGSFKPIVAQDLPAEDKKDAQMVAPPPL